MVTMSAFDESLHPRGQAGNPGQFATKTNDASLDTLVASGPVASELPSRRGAAMGRGTFGGYTLANVKKFDGREGQGFSADLRLNGKPVGHVVQEGYGGETFCRFASRDASAQFDELVATEWAFEVHYGPRVSGEAFSVPHTQETVLDALFEETDLARKLGRDHRAGKLSVMTPTDIEQMEQLDGVTQWQTFPRFADRPQAVAAYLAKTGELEGALYWDGEKWALLSDAR